VDFGAMPYLEELDLNVADAPHKFLDFSQLQHLKRLSIHNKVDFRSIIGHHESALATLQLTHLFIDSISEGDDMNFFRSLPLTLKTIGWNYWSCFAYAMYKEDESSVKQILKFFLQRRTIGSRWVGRYKGKDIDLDFLFGRCFAMDESWFTEPWVSLALF
jgi:hypothetical protein